MSETTTTSAPTGGGIPWGKLFKGLAVVAVIIGLIFVILYFTKKGPFAPKTPSTTKTTTTPALTKPLTTPPTTTPMTPITNPTARPLTNPMTTPMTTMPGATPTMAPTTIMGGMTNPVVNPNIPANATMTPVTMPAVPSMTVMMPVTNPPPPTMNPATILLPGLGPVSTMPTGVGQNRGLGVAPASGTPAPTMMAAPAGTPMMTATPATPPVFMQHFKKAGNGGKMKNARLNAAPAPSAVASDPSVKKLASAAIVAGYSFVGNFKESTNSHNKTMRNGPLEPTSVAECYNVARNAGAEYFAMTNPNENAGDSPNMAKCVYSGKPDSGKYNAYGYTTQKTVVDSNANSLGGKNINAVYQIMN